MAKILLAFFAFFILAFIVVAMYCAMVVAGRYDACAKNEGKTDLYWKKQICPRCKTGKYTLDLDPKSDMCPNICYWKDGKCPFFAPLDKPSKTRIFRKRKNKQNARILKK